jgi:hypothetical protein
MTLRDLVHDFYSETTFQLDIYQPIITFLVSRISSNPSFFFAVIALVFGFFYSRNIWYLLGLLQEKKNLFVILFMMVFILLNPIWFINGFRMYTAIHVFIFGALPYLLEGKRSRLVWIFLSILIHFSMVIPVVLLMGYKFLPRNIFVFYWFYILTSIVSEVNMQLVRDLITYLPDIIYYRINTYTDEAYVESQQLSSQSLNWYIVYGNRVLNWVAYFFVTYLFIKRNTVLKGRKGTSELFSFALFFGGVANLLAHIPSGDRFNSITNLLLYALFVIYLSRSRDDSKAFATIKYLSVPLLSLFIVVSFRFGADYFGLFTLMGNPVAALFFSDTVPFISYIK